MKIVFRPESLATTRFHSQLHKETLHLTSQVARAPSLGNLDKSSLPAIFMQMTFPDEFRAMWRKVVNIGLEKKKLPLMDEAEFCRHLAVALFVCGYQKPPTVLLRTGRDHFPVAAVGITVMRWSQFITALQDGLVDESKPGELTGKTFTAPLQRYSEICGHIHFMNEMILTLDDEKLWTWLQAWLQMQQPLRFSRGSDKQPVFHALVSVISGCPVALSSTALG